jgi:hypothetical protein
MRLPLLTAALALAIAAPASADYHAGTETATSGAVAATLAWDAGEDGPVNLRLSVTRAGAGAFQQPLPRLCGEDCGRWVNDEDYFNLADFQGDGDPEIFVRTFKWSDCCETYGIYSFDGTTYKEFARDSTTDVLAEDVDRDGDAELLTRHTRRQFSGSRLPRRVFAFAPATGLTDVTRKYPKEVQEDADFALDAIDDLKKNDPSAEAALATYVADLHLLGRGRAALRDLDSELARGVVGSPKKSRAFRARLLTRLKRYGYR